MSLLQLWQADSYAKDCISFAGTELKSPALRIQPRLAVLFACLVPTPCC